MSIKVIFPISKMSRNIHFILAKFEEFIIMSKVKLKRTILNSLHLYFVCSQFPGAAVELCQGDGAVSPSKKHFIPDMVYERGSQ